MNVYGVRHREDWQKQLCSSIQTRAARPYAHLDFLLEQKKQAESDRAREAEPGAHDRSHGAADVEGRGGVRPRTSPSGHEDTRRLGDGSLQRAEEKGVIRSYNREECSHATLCVAAEVSIHGIPGRRRRARRSHG